MQHGQSQLVDGVISIQARITLDPPSHVSLTPTEDPQGGILFVAGDVTEDGFYVKDNIGPGTMHFAWAVID